MTSAGASLEREAILLTRHLLGRECPADCVAAYVAAHHLPEARGWQRPPDEPTRFALAQPWALGFVDAAAAMTGRAPVLRAKLLVMAAILETTPDFADAFLPRRESAAVAVLALSWSVTRVALAAVVGIPFVLVLSRDAS